MQLQHPIIAAALGEQRQADLGHEAEQARLVRSSRLARQTRQRAARRWWRPATHPARA